MFAQTIGAPRKSDGLQSVYFQISTFESAKQSLRGRSHFLRQLPINGLLAPGNEKLVGF